MLGKFWHDITTSFKEWSRDKALILAAALSFFLAFSMAPLLLVAVAIAGLAFGNAAAQGLVAGALEGYVGPGAAEVIQRIMARLNRPEANLLASAAGFAGLLLGASGIFIQVQTALHIIFKSRRTDRGSLWGALAKRLLAFGIMAGTGVLLLAFLVLQTLLARLGDYVRMILPEIGWLLPPLSLALSVLMFAVAFAGLFKLLPQPPVAWRHAWRGGVLTAVLFTLGSFLITLYLGHSGTASLYGAASALFLLLLWMYYSAQIFLFGAEYTKVRAGRREARPETAPAPRDTGGYNPWTLAGTLALGGYLLGRRSRRHGLRPRPENPWSSGKIQRH